MNTDEAINYIENYGWSATRLGLGRTFSLLEKIGNPQKKLKFVHVAGSNGKGSTCAMIAQILIEAGYKTGLYISPYIQEFCERIQINNVNIPGERLAEITERVAQAADAMDDHPSQFELVTAIGFEYFMEEQCDIVVLEVGMGGALDSTNVIDAPEAAVITNIGLEHTEYLGNTLEEIASTKGGIIKPGTNCICYDGAEVVSNTIENICRNLNVPMHKADFGQIKSESSSLSGQTFAYRGTEYKISLLGRHQLYNAAVVLETVSALRSRGWNISEDAVRQGLIKTKWPARLEVLSRDPLFILDGGHNPQCAEALAAALAELLEGQKVICLLGVLADKDYKQVIDIIRPYVKSFVCATPLSGRALAANDLADYLTRIGETAVPCSTIEEGVEESLKMAEGKCPVIAFGSLYMAGEVRTVFNRVLKKQLRKTGIKARDSIGAAERNQLSMRIVKNIVSSSEFKNATTVMIYKAVKGEVRLESLENDENALQGKKLAYPLCVSKTEMQALIPNDCNSFKKGYMNIPEPDPEKSVIADPEEIDLIICPCTVFDKNCSRIGMGAGYYDRFLEKCTNAKIAAAAFEQQRADYIPAEPWDRKMDCIITECGIYF